MFIRRLLFLLIAWLFVYNFAFASTPSCGPFTCNEVGCDGVLNAENLCSNTDFNPFKDQTKASNDSNYPDSSICPLNAIANKPSTKENYRIGWGNNCAIPAGEQDPSAFSCITTANVVGQLEDTFTTIGIGSFMRENFCSAPPGNALLEGAIINKTLFTDNCSLNGDIQNNPKALVICNKCILNGKKYDHTTNKCLEKPETNKLEVDRHMTSELCEGYPNKNKPVLDPKDGKPIYIDDVPVYCPITRCNIPTLDIKVKYSDSTGNRAATIGIGTAAATLLSGPFGASVEAYGLMAMAAAVACGNCCQTQTLIDKEKASIGYNNFVQLKGKKNGDQICAAMLFPGGYTNLACKATIAPEPHFHEMSCIGKQMSNETSHSKWLIPITSLVVQVIHSVFDSMFGNPSTSPNTLMSALDSNLTPAQAAAANAPCKNALLAFQNNMKNVVRSLLVLYVILFGFRIATGSESLGKKDFFMFIMKFILVIYFSVGPLYKASDTNINDNGLLFLRKLAMDGMSSLSNMIIEAGTKTNELCHFNEGTYDDAHKYLVSWDTLDCKLSYYLGLVSPNIVGLASAQAGMGHMAVDTGIYGLLWGLLFSWNILALIFLFAFGIFLLSIVIYFTHLYVLAMVAISIMIFFGPIFVPLALFDQTKGFFDGWLKLLMGYALQPVVVMGVLTFMIVTFDEVMYSDCKFTSYDIMTDSGQELPYWILNEESFLPPSKCRFSLGYELMNLIAGGGKFVTQEEAKGDKATGSKKLVTFSKVTKDINKTSFIESLMLVTFFAFLFYFFAEQIGALAQELSGASLNAGSPNAATRALGGAASSVGNALVDKMNKKPESPEKSPEKPSGAEASTARPGATERLTSVKAFSVKIPGVPKPKEPEKPPQQEV